MADIRINSLPSTATSFNTDDYIPIDGASGGTRKMLAATLPLTDVTFGTSGPSAKSSIAARAARQGLVFDGTAGATVGTFSNWGTADFSICAWINPSLSANAYILTPTSGSDMYFTVNSNGTLRVSSGGFTQDLTSTGTVSANKWALVSYVRSGTTATFYINGIAAGTGTDSFNWGRVTGVGSSGYVGTVSTVYPYNRALSAAEVVSLYEAGVPSGADYNNASNTSIITGANSDFSSDTGYWTKVGTATIGGGVATIPNNASNITRYGLLTPGKRYRLQLTISSITGGGLYIYDGAVQSSYTTNGTKTLEWVAAGTFLIIAASGSGNVDDVLLYPVGLLLAPDAAQAGGGLTWYDTSGNAANITLPASGVTWNVPSSAKTATGWTFGATNTTEISNPTAQIIRQQFTASTVGLRVEADSANAQGVFGTTSNHPLLIRANNTTAFTLTGANATLAGNLTVSGTGTSSVAGDFSVGAGSSNVYSGRFTGAGGTTFVAIGGGANPTLNGYTANFASTTSLSLQNQGGDVLVGTTINSANGKLQLATHTTSAGGIGFGTDTSLYRNATGLLILEAASGSDSGFYLRTGGGNKALLAFSGSNTYLDYTGSLLFRAGVGGTTALTLDSSQNAAFAKSATVNSPSGTSSGLLVKAFNSTGGNVQQWADFQTSTGLTLARFLRGNGASGYDSNGLSIDSYEGFRVNLNALGGSGGVFTIAGGNLTVSGGNVISGSNWFQASNNAGLLSNLYFSSGWKYVGNGAGAAIYADASNGAIFATAAVNSGGAGAAATLTTALTIDGSQNATFAGKLYSVSGTASTPAFSFTGDTGTGMYRSSAGIGALAASGSTAAFWANNVFAIYSGVPLRLGNAYTAGAPTATGYVTIQDSAGNTYKVLVGT